MSLWSDMRRLYTGEGIGRLLMNRAIARTVSAAGVVVDIGGKGNPSYRKYLGQPVGSRIMVLDLIPHPTVDAVCSITSLPLSMASCDAVLCFNVLEHIYDYAAALRELRRVLKPGGQLYGRVPFLMNIHADPSDYWRYSAETLRRLLHDAGFAQVTIEAQGGLFLVQLNLFNPLLKFGLLRLLAAGCAVGLNQCLDAVLGPVRNRERYPLGYYFVAR